MSIQVTVASGEHLHHAEAICIMMEEAARVRGTGIAKREPSYIQDKMLHGDAIIALDGDDVIGFCYINSWDEGNYIANSGLIIHPDYRKTGLARSIKKQTFDLSKRRFPDAKLFGITTSLAVMKINSDLGYKPVTFSELTQDEAFWQNCQSCKNYDILQRTNRSMCLCTGMVCDLSTIPVKIHKVEKQRAWEVFLQFIKRRRFRFDKIIKFRTPK
ncbi:MAG: GNAT family N-acetyltransferase [Saprospiraceae bacterium]